MTDSYQQLATHLDNLPAGFPSTESGVELKILKRLFTPAEARIATGLTLMPDAVGAIAQRLEMDEAELAPILDDMSKRGLIFSCHQGGKFLFRGPVRHRHLGVQPQQPRQGNSSAWSTNICPI